MEVKTITLQRSVFADNDARARELRRELMARGTLLVNVMSSPGSGKTTALVALINALKERFRIAVMEADIDSDVDAVEVAQRTGVRSVQLHTGGMCHLDADMTRQGLEALGGEFDLIFLENVGNLVCPAEYDTGAVLDITILSVPEGDDKPAKYPLVYQKSALVLINKIDALPYFDFDIEKCKADIVRRNRDAVIIPVSAKTGENIDQAAEYFARAVRSVKENKNA